LAAFFYGREDIIPELFRRLLGTLYGAKHNDDCLRHFIYYIDRHISNSIATTMAAKHARERALCAACRSIKAQIGLWNGTLNKLRNSRSVEPLSRA
jgi:hypothetical protein